MVDTADPITDRPRFIAAIASLDRDGSYFRIDCEDGVANYGVNIPGQKFSGTEVLDIIVRVDGHPPTQATVSAYPGGGLVFGSLGRSTYSRLLVAKKVTIRAMIAQGAFTGTFDFPDAEKSLKALAKACPPNGVAEGSPIIYDPAKPFRSLLKPAEPAAGEIAAPQPLSTSEQPVVSPK